LSGGLVLLGLYVYENKRKNSNFKKHQERKKLHHEFVHPQLRNKHKPASVKDNRGAGHFNITKNSDLPPSGVYGGNNTENFDPSHSVYLGRALFNRGVTPHPFQNMDPDLIRDHMFTTLYTSTSYN